MDIAGQTSENGRGQIEGLLIFCANFKDCHARVAVPVYDVVSNDYGDLGDLLIATHGWGRVSVKDDKSKTKLLCHRCALKQYAAVLTGDGLCRVEMEIKQ